MVIISKGVLKEYLSLLNRSYLSVQIDYRYPNLSQAIVIVYLVADQSINNKYCKVGCGV